MWSAQPSLPISPVAASFNKRSGIGAFWLNLTAPPRPEGFLSLPERERIRKAELTSYSILAVFLFLLTLVSDTITQPSARFAIIAMAIGLCVAAVFNRAGWTRLAAYLVPLLLMALIMAAVVLAPGGLSWAWLPTYDLFAIPVFLSSIILDRRAPWFLAPIGIAFILLDYALQSRSFINIPGVVNFDHLAYSQQTLGWWGMVNRHVALVFFAALFSWLGAGSVEAAITRADRAEEIAKLKEAVAQSEAERTEELNNFVQELLDAFVAQANGTERYVQVPADHPMASTVQFLNQRLKRLHEISHVDTWRARQVLTAMHVLEERLIQVARGALPPTALHASTFRTNVPPVDQLAALAYAALERYLPAGRRGSENLPGTPQKENPFPAQKHPGSSPM